MLQTIQRAVVACMAALVSSSALAGPIFINTINDLQNIQSNPAGHYVLGSNIDASGFNFAPISFFTGTLDGQGHTINGLTVNVTGAAGLFSDVRRSATIENLNLTNVSIFGGNSVGGLAGANLGTIKNAYVSGSVGGAGSCNMAGCILAVVGGLVGSNSGGNVLESHTGGTVSGINAIAGGLVGSNFGYVLPPAFDQSAIATIQKSFSTATVIGQGQFTEVGGIAGSNDGPGAIITSSYALGNVTGAATGTDFAVDRTGGLAAENRSGTIFESYAAGKTVGSAVAGTGGFALNLVGGLVGDNSGVVSSSYWDFQSTGQLASGGGSALTTSQLKSGTLPAGFDPTVWKTALGAYPALQWETTFSTLLSSGVLPVRVPISIPISAFPSPDDLLPKVKPFLDHYGPLLPSETASYLDQELSKVADFVGEIDLKAAAATTAVGLQASADAITVAMAASGVPTTDSLVRLGLSTVGKAVGLSLNADAATCGGLTLDCLASYSLLVSRTALLTATCLATTAACIPSLYSFVANNLVVPVLKQFVKEDPFDPSYNAVFMLPEHILTPKFSTESPAIDAYATDMLANLELASGYMFAVLVSIDRYGSALTENDPTSAALQLQAIIHYLALYDEAMKTAIANLDSLRVTTEFNSLLSADYDTSSFLALQEDVELNGFSSADLELYQQLGLDIPELTNAFLSYVPPDRDETIGAIYDKSRSQLLNVTTGASATRVAEPPEVVIFILCLSGLVLTCSKRHR